jgi:histidinol phosphate phosphatase hisN-like protein
VLAMTLHCRLYDRSMPTALEIAAWAHRLVENGVAGPHRSHSHQNNMGKLRRTLEGDPDCTFGLSGLGNLSHERALAAMGSVVGWRPEEPTSYVEPEMTVAAALSAGRLCGEVVRPGSKIIVGTGHPDFLLALLTGIAEVLETRGAVIRRDLKRIIVLGRLAIEYVGPVAVLADAWGPVHTHSPEGMRALLELGHPDLVIADHGWAGAAMEARVPTVATLDTNDPALALGALRGPPCALIPLDDGRPLDAYEPVLEAFRAGLEEGTGTGSRPGGAGALGTPEL